ncbi:MAG: hypothetical protein DRP85_05170 [Candidatus Makaraimicrobium thalassicum]|nr:MAG: hypothetical protein DRP85_05170 [Candidatus Omnitrophota bacterium]
MNDQNLTSEDRLLKAIESHGEQGKIIRQPGGDPKDRIVTGMKRWGTALKNIKHAKLKWPAFALSLRIANNTLIILAALFTIFFIFDFVKDKMSFNDRFASISRTSPDEAEEPFRKPVPGVDLPASIRAARGRNIFMRGPQPSVVKGKKDRTEISALRLTGVLWSKNPQVMIEDTESNKTYFLSAGEKVSRWEVKRIYRDKVILANPDGEWELR